MNLENMSDEELRAVAGAAPAAKRANKPADFAQANYRHIAPVANRLRVSPEVLAAQFGLETGWGASIIPGTNNLGNIKDFSGSGVAATDSMTGSRDKYRAYKSPEEFMNDYATLIEKRYPQAIGAGNDPVRFARALKAGGYAEDPAYIRKVRDAHGLVPKYDELESMSDEELRKIAMPDEPMPSSQFADVKAGVEKTPPKSLLDKNIEFAKNVPGGLVRGAGSIGATLYSPIDALEQFVGRKMGADMPAVNRRAEMDAGLTSMGFDPASAGFKTGKIGGEIAGTAGVGGVLANAAGRVPVIAANAPNLINAIRTGGMVAGPASTTVAGNALNMGTRIAGGAITGGASAGLPDPSQAGFGAAVGAALPPVAKVAGAAGNAIGRALLGGKAAVEPFYQSGRDAILARTLRETAGGAQYADDVAARLAEASKPAVGPFLPGRARQTMGEIVPGSVPTVAQVAGNPSIAALERAASSTVPAVSAEQGVRLSAQNAARQNLLQDMAGSDGLRDFTRAELQSTADDLYRNAFEKGMDLKRNAATGGFTSKAEQAGIKGEITKLMRTPAMQEAVAQAKVMMRNEMKKVSDPAGSVLGLHYTKKALDDMIQTSSGNQQRILIGLRDRMLTTVDRLSPEYSAARNVFREMAKPLNEMDTVAAIAERAINPGTGNMTLSAFARSANDKTAAKATNFGKATLEGVMSDKNMNALNAIKQDLQRAEFALNAGRVGSNTVQNLAYTNIIKQAGIPTFLQRSGPAQVIGNLLSRGGDIAYKRQNERLAEELANALLSPEKASQLMKIAKSDPSKVSKALKNNAISQAIYRAAPAIAANR